MDIVKPLKIENLNTGSQTNFHPTETDPLEDYLATKGIALEGDILKSIDLDSEGNIRYRDSNQAAPKTFKSLTDIFKDTKEPTGFINRSDSVISFDDNTRTFSISPAVTSYTVYVQGEKLEISTTKQVTIPDVSGSYFFYLDENFDLQYTQTFGIDLFLIYAYTASVYWNSSAAKSLYIAEERHGITLDGATHFNLHSTRGSVLGQGGGDISIVLNQDGSQNSHAQIGLANMTIIDEDIVNSITHSDTPTNNFEQVLSPIAEIPIYYRDSNGFWTRDNPTQYPLRQGTSKPQYNRFDTAWSVVDITDNYYGATYVFATNSINYPVIGILGQFEFEELSGAISEFNWGSIDLSGLPFPEFKLLYILIYQVNNAYTNTPKARIIDYRDYRFGIDRESPTLANLPRRVYDRFATNEVFTTSTSDVSLPNMSITGIKSGKYIIMFEVMSSNNQQNTTTTYTIYINGNPISPSRASTIGQNQTTGISYFVGITIPIYIAENATIEVRWRTSAGTGISRGRSLILDKAA